MKGGIIMSAWYTAKSNERLQRSPAVLASRYRRCDGRQANTEPLALKKVGYAKQCLGPLGWFCLGDVGTVVQARGSSQGCAVAELQVSEVSWRSLRRKLCSNLCRSPVPPAGFEPALTAPEAVALSPELRGLKDGERLPATDGRRAGHAARRVRPAIGRAGSARGGLPGGACMRTPGEGATLAPVAQGLGRVLVVDDDEVIRQLIAVNLTLEGFDVATAVDGQDCLDKVAAIDPDVITLDIMMPRLDGWVTASQL